MFENYSKFVLKHPKSMIAVWIVAILVALPFAVQAEEVLSYDMTSMGGFTSEATEGADIVAEHFEGGLNVDTVLVIPYDDQSQLSDVEGKLISSGILGSDIAERYGDDVTYSVMGAFNSDGSDNGVFMVLIDFGELDAMDEIGNIRDVVSKSMEDAGLADMAHYVTGGTAITYDTMQGANADVAKIDPLSILLILLLLGLFFWTLVTALAPPLVVGGAYGLVLALMFALGQMFDIFYITKTIVLVSMLGAGCDYSIFIISRYREERKAGKDKSEAVTEAIKWAGESVMTSGLAVIIGFAVMSLCSYSLVSSMAIVLAIGIVVAMLAALTLIPAILAVLGDRIFWPRTIDSYRSGSRERNGVYGKLVDFSKRYFTRAGRFSTKHAVPIVVVAILLTVPMGYVALTSEDSFDMVSVMPDSDAREGVDAVTSNTDGGLIMPTYVLFQLESPIAQVTKISDNVGVLTWTNPSYLNGLSEVSQNIVSEDENISYALGPTAWSAVYGLAYQAILDKGVPESMITPEMVNRAALTALPDMVSLQLEQFFGTFGWNLAPDTMLPLSATMQVPVASLIDYAVNVGAGLVSDDGSYVQLMVIVKDEPMSTTSMESIGIIRDTISELREDDQYAWIVDSWVLGTVAKLSDISDVVNGEFHWIELGVIVLIYVLLFFVLGSYLTPVRSLATILMSVIWTLGVVQLLFVHTLSTDVVWIVPIVLFVICLGLGMDYDILLTTRIREGKLKGLSDDEAIQDALVRSGSIISLCGLIMGGTFLTLLLSGSAMLQEVGFALGFAILVDSLIVVPYVVPALMHLMGKWSWKGPAFLDRSGSKQKTEE